MLPVTLRYVTTSESQGAYPIGMEYILPFLQCMPASGPCVSVSQFRDSQLHVSLASFATSDHLQYANYGLEVVGLGMRLESAFLQIRAKQNIISNNKVIITKPNKR